MGVICLLCFLNSANNPRGILDVKEALEKVQKVEDLLPIMKVRFFLVYIQLTFKMFTVSFVKPEKFNPRFTNTLIMKKIQPWVLQVQ